MIITCASCLTKFNLEESRIPLRGAKVRCSRCHHVFYVVPPPKADPVPRDESGGLMADDDLVSENGQGEEVRIPDIASSPQTMAGLAEETDASLPRSEPSPAPKPFRRERAEVQTFKTKRALQSDKPNRSLPVIALVIVLILLVIGFFCFWTGYGGTLYSYVQYPARKIADVWNQFWGIENGMRYLGLGS